MKLPAAKDVHFDIDQYLNRFVPHNRIHRLPKPLSRFLGYRAEPAPPIGNILQAAWALIGAFCGLTVVTAVYKFAPGIAKHNPPVIIASLVRPPTPLHHIRSIPPTTTTTIQPNTPTNHSPTPIQGAAAILDYNVIATPFAQPRNALLGNTLSALTGVCITKLLMLLTDDGPSPSSSPSPSFTAHRWLAGPLSCACASALMAVTGTIYPPGGATALLAATDPAVAALGWLYVPLVLLGSALMLAVALVVNNVQRQYPVYWWTAGSVGREEAKEKKKKKKAARKAARGVVESGSRRGDEGKGVRGEIAVGDEEEEGEVEDVEEEEVRDGGLERRIVITADRVFVPEGFDFGGVDAQLVESLQTRLRRDGGDASSSSSSSSSFP
ncbi:hpp family protein [Diplodia corticola]|uniref:Hpp family protein n=1 Tax=Diplodia corticola TaxID=236234 RepID=A0A1J9QRR9_9PEZI|nr:hpp family protein [Diplodia corticola]OJD31646.1 hpp family protein [Diplodia corticola]